MASCLAASTDARAGAWTLPEGTGQAVISGLYSDADRTFDADGTTTEAPVFRKAEIGVYVEYGLTDTFTLIGQTELTTSAVDEPLAVDEARFGFTSLGARARLWEGQGAVVSAEISGRLDTRADTVSGELESEADMRLLAGTGFAVGTWQSFVDVQGAYRVDFSRHGSDEARLDITAGTRPSAPWLLLIQNFNTIDLEAPDAGAERREHKLQLSAVYDVSESVSLQVGGFSTVAGQNGFQERGVVSAVWLRF